LLARYQIDNSVFSCLIRSQIADFLELRNNTGNIGAIDNIE